MNENTAHDSSMSRTLSNELGGYAARCRSGDAPPCARACPYGLDVRELMKKLKRGSFRGAYNTLAEQLLFPQTLCALCGGACEAACAAETGAEPLRIRELERAAFAYSGEKKVTSFRVPPKNESAAVVGAGLCGLSCAYVLASMGYKVSVFERSDKIGGSLWGRLPEELFMPELRRCVEACGAEIVTGKEINDLGELSGFSGVLIAAGADSGLDLSQERTGVFFAGEIRGADITKSVIYGRKAAIAMDTYMKTGAVTEIEVPHEAAAPTRTAYEGEPMSREEAAAEAGRCLQCDCRACFDNCQLMQFYRKLPERIVTDARATLNPVEKLKARTATRLIASCSDCGVCSDVCPEGIDMGAFLLRVRTAMNNDRCFPPAFHDFWLRDMAFANSREAAYFSAPKNGKLFFPGCQLGASKPEYVTEAYALLNKALPGTGIITGCCGVPAKWAGETPVFEKRLGEIRALWESSGRPRVITACPTCLKTFREWLPEIEAVSLYTVLAALPGEAREKHGERVAVFHPCAGRKDTETQKSIYTLLESRGVEAGELENEDDRNGCCGFGGHIYPANPELFDTIAEKRAASQPLEYVTYCANCRDIFASKGKSCRHILDVLSGRSEGGDAPSLEQKRKNRLILKSLLSGEKYAGEDKMELKISDELRKKLDRQLILDDDIRGVIAHCEGERAYILTGDGRKTGHLKQGMITCWVTWKGEGDSYEVVNVYSHRMVLEGE